MKRLRQFCVSILALGLASCATSNPVDYDGITTSIQSGEKAGVITTFKPSGSRVHGIGKDLLLSAHLKFEHVETNKSVGLTFSEKGRIQQIEPGRYTIKSGGVRGPNVTGNMPLLQLWVEDFDIKGGEVVDLGELNMNRIKVNVKTDGVNKTFNALISLGTDINDDQTHVTYEIEASSAKDINNALKKFPALEGKVISRSLEMRFTEEEFRDAIDKASARTEDGRLPSRFEVMRKLEASLRRLTLKSTSDQSNSN